MTSWRSSSSRWSFWGERGAWAGRAGIAPSRGWRAETSNSHPEVEDQDSKVPSKLQGVCEFCRLTGPAPATQLFQPCAGLLVKPVGQPVRGLRGLLGLGQLVGEAGGADLHDLVAGGAAYGRVGGDEAHRLGAAVLGGEPLQERVGMRRVADLERADRLVCAGPVEDDDTAGALERHEAREAVDEFAHACER